MKGTRYIMTTFELEYLKSDIYCEKCENDVLYGIMVESDNLLTRIAKFAKSIVDKIISFAKTAIEKIKSIFQKKSVKAALSKYDKALKDDPSLKDVKVKIIDIDKFEKLVDEYSKKIENSNDVNKTMNEYRKKCEHMFGFKFNNKTYSESVSIVSNAKTATKQIVYESKPEIKKTIKQTIGTSLKAGRQVAALSTVINLMKNNLESKSCNMIEQSKDTYSKQVTKVTNNIDDTVDEETRKAMERSKALFELYKSKILGRNYFIQDAFHVTNDAMRESQQAMNDAMRANQQSMDTVLRNQQQQINTMNNINMTNHF